MKNNIIISGVSRAGKSTISHQLAKQYGYQHISMDSIIAEFEKCFPETGWRTGAEDVKMVMVHLCRDAEDAEKKNPGIPEIFFGL